MRVVNQKTKWFRKSFPLLAILFSGVGVWMLDIIFFKTRFFSSIWQFLFDFIYNSMVSSPITICLLIINISLTTFLFINVNVQKNKKKDIDSETECKPDIIFSNKIILRKVKFGPRTQDLKRQFALAFRILISNQIELYNSKITLIYMHRKRDKNSALLQRHGVEEFSTSADYIDTIHRCSFFSDELSYRVLKPISEPRGSSNYDRILIVMTGFYGDTPKSFMYKQEYSFSDIVFADQTPKVVTYDSNDEKVINSDNFHIVNELTEEEQKIRQQEIRSIVEEMDITKKSNPFPTRIVE